MEFCLCFAAFLSFVSIFAFFGNYSQIPYGNNMFLRAFGGTTVEPLTGQSHAIEKSGLMTFLFILQIVIMLASISVFFNMGPEKNKKMKVEFSGFGVLSIAAIIICTIDTGLGGYGPIAYSSIHTAAIILDVIAVTIYLTSNKNEEQAYMGSGKKPIPKWGKLSEEEIEREIETNKDLFKRGIINRSEFDKKVAELKARGYNSNSEDDKKKV